MAIDDSAFPLWTICPKEKIFWSMLGSIIVANMHAPGPIHQPGQTNIDPGTWNLIQYKDAILPVWEILLWG